MGDAGKPEPQPRSESGGPQQTSDAFESYQTVAETVGGVPSLRVLDNVIQGVIVAIGTVVGALVGHTWWGELSGHQGLLLGAGAGLIVSVLLSGVIFTGITLAIGVATWIFAPIKFQADMGILLTFMFLLNMACAIILLPALAYWLKPKG